MKARAEDSAVLCSAERSESACWAANLLLHGNFGEFELPKVGLSTHPSKITIRGMRERLIERLLTTQS